MRPLARARSRRRRHRARDRSAPPERTRATVSCVTSTSPVHSDHVLDCRTVKTHLRVPLHSIVARVYRVLLCKRAPASSNSLAGAEVRLALDGELGDSGSRRLALHDEHTTSIAGVRLELYRFRARLCYSSPANEMRALHRLQWSALRPALSRPSTWALCTCCTFAPTCSLRRSSSNRSKLCSCSASLLPTPKLCTRNSSSGTSH